MFDLPPRARLPLLLLAMLSLVGGVLAGLARLGWHVPTTAAQAAGFHGPLMIAAFFATIIGLERAVAIGRWWAYLAPFAAGLGGLLLLLGGPSGLAQGGVAGGALGLVASSLAALRRQPALHARILLVAAACLLVGDLAWALGSSGEATPWWLSFLLLTIAGERLELTRFLPTPPLARHVFVGLVVSLLAGAVLMHFSALGTTIFAAGLLALALWLLRYDIARRNLGARGLTRFIAICLLSGYVWLALAGLLGLAGALTPGHPWRDAALHALGLGFVFAMVLGHAPIIFPAVMRVRIPWHPALYLPLLLLHAGVALRVGSGLLGKLPAHAGLFNAASLLVFVATMLFLVRRGRQADAGHLPA